MVSKKNQNSKKESSEKKEISFDDIPQVAGLELIKGRKKLSEFQALQKRKRFLAQGMQFGKIPTLQKYISRKDARNLQKYVEAVVGKFGKYIKSIVVGGSSKTGKGKKKTSDIDVAIIVDDTDVQRMTRIELKEKLFQKMVDMAYPISKKIHPQAYLLTEFWEYVREGNPVLFNLILRDGIILFDTGFILPMQMLMRMGRIKPSKEAVDKLIQSSNDLIRLTEETMTHKLAYNLGLAAVSATQALMVEMGYRPPVPKEAAEFIEKYAVPQKILTKEDANIVKGIVKIFKDIEHKEKKQFTGKEYDEWIERIKEFVKKAEKQLKKLRTDKGITDLYEFYDKLSEEKKKEMKLDGIIGTEKIKDASEEAEEIIRKRIGQR